MNCIIVDDDEFSRTIIKQYVHKTRSLNLVAECENAIDAFEVIKNNDHIDVVFLDVEMPEMSGIELVKSLRHMPQVILITSRMHYAVEAFEINITDYLVKPVNYPRFLKAVDKAQSNVLQNQPPQTLSPQPAAPGDPVIEAQQDYVFVKTDNRIVRIKLDEIIYIEALSDYVIINTTTGKHIVHATMKGIEKKLPALEFMRVHRSFIINTKKIEAIEDVNIVMPGKTIPIGVSYKNDFLKKLNFLA